MKKYGDDDSDYELSLSHGEPIIVYMHGNSGTRANDQRIQLYRKLRNINCHVIAVDYRSTYTYIYNLMLCDILIDSLQIEILRYLRNFDVHLLFRSEAPRNGLRVNEIKIKKNF